MAEIKETVMNIFKSREYLEDVEYVASLDLPWNKLENRSVLISGATGLIGSFLVDVIMDRNLKFNMNCRIYALGRSEEKAKNRFPYCVENSLFEFVAYDITYPLRRDDIGNIDYVLHLASNTHPLQYSSDPVGTITTNVLGTCNMFDFAVEHEAVRCLLASSNEIYGENRGDVELFDEHYCGYIDSNTMRAGYPESKRCSEALCQAYIRQKGMDIVIPRLTRSYGPTMLKTDSKAISQFIKKGIAGEDIVLKSAGTQYYSYTYVADAVSGLLTVLLKGECGEAYNIADTGSDIQLKNLASIIATYVGTSVVFEIPDSAEAAGYSRATKARLDGSKLKQLGWKPKYDIQQGIERTIRILKNVDKV